MSEAEARKAFGQNLIEFGKRIRNTMLDEALEFETEKRFQEFAWQERGLAHQFRSECAEKWSAEFMGRAKAFFETLPDALKPKYDMKMWLVEHELYGEQARPPKVD